MDLKPGVIDVSVHAQFGAASRVAPFPLDLLRDEPSREQWPSLEIVDHMFGDSTDRTRIAQESELLIREMDRFGISKAQVPMTVDAADTDLHAIEAAGDRFFVTLRLNPHDGYRAVRTLDNVRGAHQVIKSVSIMPATLYPPVPPSSREFYPIYAKCIELGIPVMLNVGFAGPRVPSGVQHPMHIDEVAWFFPELRIVMKHGGMPWADVCVSLLRKWPNVFYTTSGLAPKRYPREVVEYMASARQHKVIYGGYFPHIDFARSFAELSEIPLSDERAARFLRDNAAQVFDI